jgi:hypothetical protein
MSEFAVSVPYEVAKGAVDQMRQDMSRDEEYRADVSRTERGIGTMLGSRTATVDGLTIVEDVVRRPMPNYVGQRERKDERATFTTVVDGTRIVLQLRTISFIAPGGERHAYGEAFLAVGEKAFPGDVAIPRAAQIYPALSRGE